MIVPQILDLFLKESICNNPELMLLQKTRFSIPTKHVTLPRNDDIWYLLFTPTS